MRTKTKTKPRRAAGPASERICSDCGSPMVSRRQAHRFPMAGDLSATLEDIEVSRCSKCSYYQAGIDQPEALARTVAAAVARKRSRLVADEILFLRGHLRLTGSELARVLGVTKGTISRWENGHEAIGTTPDHLLRALVMLQDGGEPAARGILAQIEDAGDGKPIKLTIRQAGPGAWEVAKAA